MSTLTAAQPATLKSMNPASGEVVGEVPVATAQQITAAVARSRAAQESWRGLGIDKRVAALGLAGPKLVQRADELGLLLTREMGKPLAEAVGEVTSCGERLSETLAEITEALRPEILEDKSTRSVVHRDPFGVCAAISPWNFPMAMPHWMIVPALAAGNTVVLKPSEETPLIAQAYVELVNESLPAGVLQVVHGAAEQGEALVAADVDLIVFTGSHEAGKHILASASAGLKRVILELGGKDPMIVMDGADVAEAAKFAVRNSFRNAGQVCVSTERIYVDNKIADRFEAEVVKLTGRQRVGEGTAEGVTVGPMINARQRDHVLAQIDDAVRRGAKVLAGGTGHRDGFIMPTVLADVTGDMDIMRAETFGPVACISRYGDPNEAVAHANDTPFGLGAVVFGPTDRAAELARHLHAGMIGVNKSCGGATGCPWVGAKGSGYGWHSGKEGHRQFTQVRVVSIGK